MKQNVYLQTIGEKMFNSANDAFMSVIAIVVSGVLALGAGRLLSHDRKTRTFLSAILFLALMWVGRAALNGLFTPQDPVAAIDKVLQQNELFRTLKDVEPQTYQQLIDEMRSMTARGENLTREQSFMLGQRIISPLLTRRVPQVSDAVLHQFVRATIAQLDMLRARDPQLCYSTIFAQNVQDMNPQVQLEIAEKSGLADIFLPILRDPGNHNPPAVSEAQKARALADIQQALAARFGEKMRVMDAPENAADAAAREQVCLISIELYRNLNTPDDPVKAALLRDFLTASQ